MVWPPRSRLLPPRSALRVLRCPPGGLIHLGAARRWIALPPARPAVFTLHKLGRPGRWGVWCSGIKEEAAGRGTAAAPNATPAWSATRPRYTTRQIASKLGLSGARTAGGQRSSAQSSCTAAPCPKQTWQTRLVGRLAQRHQGGGRRPGDSRSAECQAGLVRDTTPLHHPADRLQTWHSPRRAYLARARRASLMPSLTPTSWGSALSAAAASRSL